jgi:hypothetical protein
MSTSTLEAPSYDPFFAPVGGIGVNDGASNVLVDISASQYHSTFTGGGPKFGMDVAIPLFDRLELFAAFRGTVLIGGRTQKAGFTAQQQIQLFESMPTFGVVLTFNADTLQLASRSKATVIPMAEGELGLQMRFGENSRLSPFIRVGAIGQYWGNAGNATDDSASLSLIGFSATLGVAF